MKVVFSNPLLSMILCQQMENMAQLIFIGNPRTWVIGYLLKNLRSKYCKINPAVVAWIVRVPDLELISRAVSSVGVMYRSSGPNTGSNPGGEWILNN